MRGLSQHGTYDMGHFITWDILAIRFGPIGACSVKAKNGHDSLYCLVGEREDSILKYSLARLTSDDRESPCIVHRQNYIDTRM